MICPGCGVDTEPDQVPFPDYIGTTGGCWRRYSETLALVSADRWDPATNRLMVDAYAAQHPGRPGRQADQSVAVHLVGLLLVLEFRFEAGRATRVMDALLRKRRHYPRLERTPAPGEPTIKGFAGVEAPDQVTTLARRWASAVWESYATHRGAILAIAELGLGDKLSSTE